MKNIALYKPITASLLLICLGFIQKSEPALKDVFKNDFYIGTAMGMGQINGRDEKGIAIIKKHYNTITPENALKWRNVHPQPDEYNFKPADDFVAFGEQNKMYTIGHTLVWHQQAPTWLFTDKDNQPVSKEVLLQRMQDHITTVVSRYKGKIKGWDVVNEAVEEDGSLRKSKWSEILGEEFIFKAFELAHRTDPKTELYYNDYNLYRPSKREGVIRVVKNLQAKGIPVKAIGMQGHYGIVYPPIADIEASILAFSKLGVEVNITELDIDVLPKPGNRTGADLNENYAYEKKNNPYTAGLPDSVQQQLAQRYAEIFALFRKHRDKIGRVTFWGVSDGNSWLNNFPIRGRTNYPLLFDREYNAKPAFQAVVNGQKKGK